MKAADRQRPAPGELCVDHLGHFVPDLDAAARLLDTLGLSATPVSHHRISGKPAGTANRCVMLEEGYLEILCPTLDTPHAQRVRGLMARYAGVHLACFGTPDAAFEHQRLAAYGFQPELIDLGRTIDTGEALRFRVVYVAPGKMPEGRVQYCEHLTPQFLWKKKFVNPLSLREVYVVASRPVAAAARWAEFSGLLPKAERGLVRIDCARGAVLFGTRAALAKRLGKAPRAPAIAGYGLACRDAAALAARCRKAGLKVKRSGKRYVVALPPALGGVWVLGERTPR
jgi:hypothetical protein